MKKFDLETPIMQLGGNCHPWTLRNAVEGIQIFGSVGSGKTSGSGRTLAIKYLSMGFGGLILTVKPDEVDLWRQYARIAGRIDDLIVVEPSGEYGFDFLKYLTSTSNGAGAITSNVLESLKTVMRAAEAKSSGKSDDPFWESALDMLLFHVIDLCMLAYGTISVQMMYDIVQSLPRPDTENKEDAQDHEPKLTAFKKAFAKAKALTSDKVTTWFSALSGAQQEVVGDDEVFENAILEAIPEARLLKFLDTFFYETFKELSEKTRSIIDFSFSSFLFQMLRDPIYSLFCNSKVNVNPEQSIEGKLLLINLPVKKYNKVGRDCQVLFKYLWQTAMEKRDVRVNERPVFLWADESQTFLHEHDSVFQATARSSRIATVYITQNLPNYLASMGGLRSDDRVKSFLGTLGTKVFHANSDLETNKYASELIGDAVYIDPSRSITISKEFSQSDSMSLKIDRRVRPEEFVGMRTGSERNNWMVEAYIHVQGDPLFNGNNYKRVKFAQNYY